MKRGSLQVWALTGRRENRACVRNRPLTFLGDPACIASASEKCCHVLSCHRATRAAWNSGLGWPVALQATASGHASQSAVFLCSGHSPNLPPRELASVSLRRWTPARSTASPLPYLRGAPCSVSAGAGLSRG